MDYKLIPVREGDYPFPEGQVWADADVDHAAWQMRQVVANPDLVRQKTAAARDLITREYGIDAVSKRQLARLRSLEGR